MSSVDFSKLLKDKNLKVTAQRVAILDEIYKHGHSSVDDIYALIRGRYDLQKYPFNAKCKYYQKHKNAHAEAKIRAK